MANRLVICLMLFMCLQLDEVKAATSSYAVIDGQTGRLLLGTAPHAQLPIASLTKMWTAFVVVTYSNLADEVTISDAAVRSEGSSIYLEAGDVWTVEELLHGLMLRSGNDAAHALAEHTGGSVEGFVYLMNDLANKYGLANTMFTNPSGLHDDQHMSTAYDTAKMLQIAMQNEDFRRIASTPLYKGRVAWQNKHRLIHEEIGMIAGKTGFTKKAGRTLASFFEREQKQMIVVTLNEPDDWNKHRLLVNMIDSTYEVIEVAKRGNYHMSNIQLTVEEPIKLLLKKEEASKLKHVALISRVPASTRAVWYVLLDGERIASKLVMKQQ
ncbi:MAG: D-alanyl-D-alanine carboxypeptidase family protein [Solibacillus sp.]